MNKGKWKAVEDGPNNTDEVAPLSEQKMYPELAKKVKKIVKESTFLEMYGFDMFILLLGFCALPLGFLLVSTSPFPLFVLGLFILGSVHVMFITKGAHAAAHNALGPWKRWNHFWGIFFTEVVGGFTFDGGCDIHIKSHHPHTNVVGLGDSSTWKVPFLGRISYLFLAPHALPLVAPLFSFSLQKGKWDKLGVNAIFIALGFFGQYHCFRDLSGLSPLSAVACLLAVRSMYYCPYIHINIFQHIGLSFYDPNKRPHRVRLMATGALNLSRNLILDILFGHSLSHCHVEHHLFPNLSDNMCLKIKPTVQSFLLANGLPYNEDSYWNRLVLFFTHYKELMVDPPPLTNFIGIQ